MGESGRIGTQRKTLPCGAAIDFNKDYRVYNFTGKEACICAGEAVLISALIAFLFYQSPWGMCVIIIILPILFREQKQRKSKQRKNRLNLEFKECIHSVAGALLAGYSIENAFIQSGAEMRKLYGDDSMIVKELEQIQLRLNRNEALEKILQDFSNRSGCDDIESFTEVFSFAKRGGGDFVQIIQTTSDRINDKIEVHREIQTILASKEMEQKIMCMVPLGILLFFQLTSSQMLAYLYGSLTGVVTMTVALIVYGVAIKMSAVIIDIEV